MLIIRHLLKTALYTVEFINPIFLIKKLHSYENSDFLKNIIFYRKNFVLKSLQKTRNHGNHGLSFCINN